MNTSSLKRMKYAMDYEQAKKLYETMDQADIVAAQVISPIMNDAAKTMGAEVDYQPENPEGLMYEFYSGEKKLGIATVDIDIQGSVNIRLTKTGGENRSVSYNHYQELRNEIEDIDAPLTGKAKELSDKVAGFFQMNP